MDEPRIELTEDQQKALQYYEQKYTVVADYWFESERKIYLKDHDSDEGRRCRFCGRSKPEVTFRKEAHAIPEFLGNKSIVSLNECDECNEYFSASCEDHLSKWFGPMRTISQMRGKKNKVPNYKTNDEKVRLELGKFIVKNDDKDAFPLDSNSQSFGLPFETPTQPFVPIKCAQALVKVACSIIPRAGLHEVKPAINWIRGKAVAEFTAFPVLFAFTPGPNPYGMGRVFLLRRKVDEKIPFLWCILATTNYLFQFFVPFCPSDAWQRVGEDFTFKPYRFPVPFPEDYPYGKTQYGMLNWASSAVTTEQRSVQMHFDEAVKIEHPDGATIDDIERLIREHENE